MADKGDVLAVLMIGGVAVATIGLVGSCIHDYRTSTPQIVHVVVMDKRHVDGHYEQECSTGYQEIGDVKFPVTTCDNVWYPPTWTIEYDDGQDRHRIGVGEGMYDRVQIGEHRFVSYYRGGYWGYSYDEKFLLEKPPAEGQ